MNTNYLFNVCKTATYDNNVFEITDYATERYVYVQNGETPLFYCKQRNKVFVVDHDSKSMKELDLREKAIQSKVIKNSFDEFSIVENEAPEEQRTVLIKGKNDTMDLEIGIQLTRNALIANTAYNSYTSHLNQSSLIEVCFNDDELPLVTNISMVRYGMLTSHTVEVKRSSFINEDVDRFDYLLQYKF